MSDDEEIRSLPPSERPKAKQALEDRHKELQIAQAEMLREDFGRTFQTQHGKRVLAWLAERAGWGKPPLAADNSGLINEKHTTHNAMELSLYIKIRQFIPVDVLQQVEYGQIKPSGTIEDPDTVIKRRSKKKKE
jgi:hypothetical protein